MLLRVVGEDVFFRRAAVSSLLGLSAGPRFKKLDMERVDYFLLLKN